MTTPRKTSSAQVELVLLPSLRNCLVNLPASLVTVLVNSNTLAQNVVVELSFRVAAPTQSSNPQDPKNKSTASSIPKSVFLGWTGLQSQTKMATILGRDGGGGLAAARAGGRQEAEVPTVEMDAAFAGLVGLSEGMKVSVALHLDPVQAHTVNIEPVTATDWEIIELHARFLETNFLSRVRALPNPAAGNPHPLTLHLTPTVTANIIVTSLTPAPASTQTFVKIAPDAEVIVAPKTRSSASRPSSAKENRSINSTSRRSVASGGKSAAGTSRAKSGHEDDRSRPPLFLRGITRALKNEWFEDVGEEMKDEGLKVWLDRDHLHSKTLRGVTWVSVTVIKPAGLQEPPDPQSPQTPEHLPASRVAARLCVWDDAPDSRHVALSSLLCAVLGYEGLVGGIVRIEPAPARLPKVASAMKEPSQQGSSKDTIVKRLKITPFAGAVAKTAGFTFGGTSKAEKEEAVANLRTLFGKTFFEGPLTDGMMLPKRDNWPGGILDFDPTPPGDPAKARTNWLLGTDRKLDMVMQAETPPPKLPQPPGEPLSASAPHMVGVDSLTLQVRSSLLHGSSVLLTGGLGAGKSSLSQVLAHQLRDEYLFNVISFPCRKLVSDEMRVKTIKDTLRRVFATAAWNARLGGHALVVLDDLDKLCPVETELQVDSNGRSRQVSELLCGIVREFCRRGSGVVLLATAQSKDAVHNIIIGGHVVMDILALKAPDKDGRRKVLEMLIREAGEAIDDHDEPATVDVNGSAASEWMEGSDDGMADHREHSKEDPHIDPDLDLLDVAGRTDGYMPGDLALLVSRARSEALIRAVSDRSLSDDIVLSEEDFTAAFKGFTPASLRGVTLHSSTTTFAAIGGLKQTRQILLETLQYPTTYAPLFARCPLRLRSGLLLYGYPGCGKTLLASAVAGECGLNFISVKGPEILNKYIGASEKSVRDLFERAEAAKPCVLFFDEFDAIAPKRGHDSTGVTDRVVNMLLTMMDGAEGLSGVYVLAATSRPDLIDPALLRPGRLDKSLLCDMPDEQDRREILQAISENLHVDASVLQDGEHGLAEVAKRTEGYSGADLQAVIYNAHLEAIHDVLGPGHDFEKRKGGSSSGGSRSGGLRHQDFTYFRFGGDDTSPTSADDTQSAATVAAERAQIAAKLAAMQLAKRKAKAERHAQQQQQRPSSAGGAPNGTAPNQGQKHPEPVITWKHLLKSLESGRASISAQERRRLERIYREFVTGRNGEMSDGQGSSEVGGRTSLM